MQIRKIMKNIDLLLANKDSQAKITDVADEVLKERSMSKCPTHKALMRIDKLINSLVGRGFTSSEIARVLKKSDIPVSAQTVRSFCVRQGYISKNKNDESKQAVKTMQTTQPQQSQQAQQAQQQSSHAQKPQPQYDLGASRVNQVQQQKQ